MKVAVVLLIVCVGMAVAMDFDAFLSKYGKKYTGAEYARRQAIFEKNMKIAAANQKRERSTATHGPTVFFDLTFEEWQAKYLSAPVPGAVLAKNCLKQGIYQPAPRGVQAPASWDWRTVKDVVTPVKDQASCGSCWAFSAAANIEGILGVAGKSMGDMSPQYIVDCSKGCSSEMYQGSNITVCNQGCGGGWPWTAFFDVIAQGGIPTWDEYPYAGYDQTCLGNKFSQVAKISNYTCISGPNAADEKDMMASVYAYGPLSIAMDANSFFSYTGGILDDSDCDATYLNHAILLVGYGTENGVDYWIVKNSWNTSWGEQGYVRVVRGKGMCGINEGVLTANL